MARILTGDKMISSVRKRTMTPDDVSTFTDEDILELIDEELQVQVLDKLIALHGENLTYSVDVPKNSTGSYAIPYRAVGNKLRDVSLIIGDQVYELSQISIGELPDHNSTRNFGYNLDLFYVENNKIKLVDPSRQFDSMRIKYYLRPSYLTKLDKAGVISSIIIDEDLDTYTLTLSSYGRNFTATSTFDIVGARTPNKIKAFDLEPSSVTLSNTTAILVFTLSELPSDYSDIVVGDYVSLAEETPIPNIPTEMHPLIAQAAAVHLLESTGDFEAVQIASQRLDKISKSTQFLIDDRVELAPKKIKPRHGTLQGINKNSRGSY